MAGACMYMLQTPKDEEKGLQWDHTPLVDAFSLSSSVWQWKKKKSLPNYIYPIFAKMAKIQKTDIIKVGAKICSS